MTGNVASSAEKTRSGNHLSALLIAGKEIIQVEMMNMLMYYKKAKLIFHRRITTSVDGQTASADSLDEAKARLKVDVHSTSNRFATKPLSDPSRGAGDSDPGSRSLMQTGKTMSFKAGRGGGIGPASTTTFMLPQSERRNYVVGGAAKKRGGVGGSASRAHHAYSRESLYCEWYSQFPM